MLIERIDQIFHIERYITYLFSYVFSALQLLYPIPPMVQGILILYECM